eukprot:CAMPEP_0117462970 /NCGR_PEP_ID=MMETSP0784-20121206/3330_1 /TAXON_ID=39447 /ORGANISM="" /LENGTH=213 /DNA_ID=CAMNT_0005256755 /DNA_START=283 /DNA_END=921 /DNA_ORIENTATION=-
MVKFCSHGCVITIPHFPSKLKPCAFAESFEDVLPLGIRGGLPVRGCSRLGVHSPSAASSVRCPSLASVVNPAPASDSDACTPTFLSTDACTPTSWRGDIQSPCKCSEEGVTGVLSASAVPSDDIDTVKRLSNVNGAIFPGSTANASPRLVASVCAPNRLGGGNDDVSDCSASSAGAPESITISDSSSKTLNRALSSAYFATSVRLRPMTKKEH